MAQKQIDLRGVKVNMLTFIAPTEDPKVWTARCDCGRTVKVRHSNVRHQGQRSCGCAKRKHNMSTHPAYKAWNAMMARCYTPANADYPRNGGRGIKVDERWHQFENFWLDMGYGWTKGGHLLRIDKDGDFAPWNTIWGTHTQVARARRPRVLIPASRGLASVREICEQYGITEQTLRSRIRRGWPPARLLSPVDVSKRNGRARA